MARLEVICVHFLFHSCVLWLWLRLLVVRFFAAILAIWSLFDAEIEHAPFVAQVCRFQILFLRAALSDLLLDEAEVRYLHSALAHGAQMLVLEIELAVARPCLELHLAACLLSIGQCHALHLRECSLLHLAFLSVQVLRMVTRHLAEDG